jgi:APA family basic amino acid/polyamine antiporter
VVNGWWSLTNTSVLRLIFLSRVAKDTGHSLLVMDANGLPKDKRRAQAELGRAHERCLLFVGNSHRQVDISPRRGPIYGMPGVVVETSSASLKRAVGRWGLAALMLNTMIGASIFGLPSLIAARLGRLSPMAYVIGAAIAAVVAACLSEVASQFSATGGPYLYARAALGRFVAIQIGWLTWLTRIAAASAVVNLFVSYLGEFLPAVRLPLVRAGVLTLVIGFLAIVNYRGVASGSIVSNFFTSAKLLMLLIFIGAGLAALILHPEIRVSPEAVPASTANWLDAIVLMILAFGGFEAALFLAGEARDPRKDAPGALLIAIACAAAVYIAVQYVVIYTLPSAGTSTTPAVDAARRFLGPWGVSLVALGTLVSSYGSVSANMLHTPRLTFAMGEQGDFPRVFAAIHPRYRTPHFSIVAFAVLFLLFSIGGDFRWNATLAAISRLFLYGAIAVALPRLRRLRPQASRFRLPAAPLFVGLALASTIILVTRIHWATLTILGITFSVGLANWLWVRRVTAAPETFSELPCED